MPLTRIRGMTEKTLLVIDTEIETIQKIMTTLESEGFLVFKASNKDSGLFTAKRVKPSLIFINLGMSGARGLEICKAIHDDEALNHIPIIIITPHGGTIDPRYTSLYGIIDFLKIPFTIEELIVKTNTVLARDFMTPHYEIAAEQMTPGPASESEQADKEESAEEPRDVKSEEHVITQPLGEENEVGASEEHPLRITEESPARKEDMPDIQYVENETIPSGSLSAEDGQEQIVQHVADDEDRPAVDEEKGEPLSDHSTPRKPYDEMLTGKYATKRRRIAYLAMLLVLVGIIGLGFLFYENFTQRRTVAILKKSSSQKDQREAATLQPSGEIKEAQDIYSGKPAQPPAVETKGQAKSFYVIQIGAFKVEANARSFMNYYREKGYDSHMEKSSKDKEVIYRVFIGTYESRNDVVRAARAIKTKEKIGTIILRR
ncbi:MAG: SPOR domain-containing protein [Nitrospirota bacterium]